MPTKTYKKKINPRIKIILILILILILAFGGWIIRQKMAADVIIEAQPPIPRSLNIHNYNNWSFWTGSNIYATFQEKLALAAKHDTLTYGESWDQAGVTTDQLRTLNPEIKLYRIYTLDIKPSVDTDWNNPEDTSRMAFPISKQTIDANDWWLRDGNGNIVIEPHETTIRQFIDVGKPGVKEAFLENVISRNQDKGFDGFVFDYWWPSMISWWITRPGLPAPAQYPNDEEWNRIAWIPFVTYVMDGVHQQNYKILGNCAGEYFPERTCDWEKYDYNSVKDCQRELLDGTVYEQGFINWWEYDQSGWLDGNYIERRINSISLDPLDTWISVAGLKKEDPDFELKNLVNLAGYYIALPDDPKLQANHYYHYSYDGSLFWDNLWDFYIGEPSKEREQIYVNDQKKYAWQRKYTEGLVLLNYGEDKNSTENITFELDQLYLDEKGETFSGSITLPAHSAKILQTVYTSPGWYDYGAGWNMISYPAIGNIQTDLVLPESYQNYSYDALLKSYVEEEHLTSGKGYWLNIDNLELLEDQKYPLVEQNPVKVEPAKGWNLLGNPFFGNLYLDKITFTTKDGQTKTFYQAANEALIYGYAWVYEHQEQSYHFIAPDPERYKTDMTKKTFVAPYRGFWLLTNSDNIQSINLHH